MRDQDQQEFSILISALLATAKERRVFRTDPRVAVGGHQQEQVAFLKQSSV